MNTITSDVEPLQPFNVSELNVYKALINLDPNKALGIDGIGPKVLKYCAKSLVQPLCHLFNLSLSTCVIPTEWKSHRIILIFKSGNRLLISNNLLILLLCNASKVLEQIILAISLTT